MSYSLSSGSDRSYWDFYLEKQKDLLEWLNSAKSSVGKVTSTLPSGSEGSRTLGPSSNGPSTFALSPDRLSSPERPLLSREIANASELSSNVLLVSSLEGMARDHLGGFEAGSSTIESTRPSLSFSAPEKRFYFNPDFECPSRILPSITSVPFPELQVAPPGCVETIDEASSRFSELEASPTLGANAISLEDIESTACKVMDSQLSLQVDASMLEAQLALDLEHLRARFYELIHLRLAVKRGDAALKQIEAYSKRENFDINYFLLECLRSSHPRWSTGNLNQHHYNQSRERKQTVRRFLDLTTHAREAVDTFMEDPSSLLEGRLHFRYDY